MKERGEGEGKGEGGIDRALRSRIFTTYPMFGGGIMMIAAAIDFFFLAGHQDRQAREMFLNLPAYEEPLKQNPEINLPAGGGERLRWDIYVMIAGLTIGFLGSLNSSIRVGLK